MIKGDDAILAAINAIDGRLPGFAPIEWQLAELEDLVVEEPLAHAAP